MNSIESYLSKIVFNDMIIQKEVEAIRDGAGLNLTTSHIRMYSKGDIFHVIDIDLTFYTSNSYKLYKGDFKEIS